MAINAALLSRSSLGGGSSSLPVAPADAAFVGLVVADPAAALPPGAAANAVKRARVRSLDLSRRGVQAVRPGTFEPFPSLEALRLDGNALVSAEGLDSAPPTLKVLSLAGNAVPSLGPLGPLTSLEELDAGRNALTRLDPALDVLERFLGLRALVLEGNPLAQEPAYRARTLARLPWLATLDRHVVTAEERAAARLAHGGAARGAAALEAASLARAAALALRAVAAAAGPAPPAEGTVGRGGARVSFGEGAAAETSTAAATRRGVARAGAARRAAAVAAARAQFADASARAGWGGELADAATGRLETRGEAARPDVVTSALINAREGWRVEDVVTRAARVGMLARGVEAELLGVDVLAATHAAAGAAAGGAAGAMLARAAIPPRGRTYAERAAERDAAVAMRVALAPAIEPPPGSHPLPPPRGALRPDDGAGVGGGVGGGAGGTTRLFAGATTTSSGAGAAGARAAAFPALSRTLEALLPPARPSEAAVFRDELTRTGVRLGRSSSAGAGARAGAGAGAMAGSSARGGHSSRGAARPPSPPPPHVHSTSSSRLTFEGTPLPASVPVLPALLPSGHLGAWDVWKLSGIFRAADADGSGELDEGEIAGCLAACADYGFCVDLDPDGPDGPASPLSTALMGTAGDVPDAPGAAAELRAAVGAIFREVDADGSGTVSWREFMDALEGAPRKTLREEAAARAAARGAAAAAARSASASRGGSRGASRGGAPAPGAAPGAAPPPRPRARATPASTLVFRPLTSGEARERASRYWAQAARAWARLQSAPAPAAGDAAAERALARDRSELLVAQTKGNRLEAIADALGGRHDPPPRPRPWGGSSPPGRADYLKRAAADERDRGAPPRILL